MRRWIARRRDNYRMLRAAVDREGKRLEAMSYETLRQMGDKPSEPTLVDGRAVYFSAEVVDVRPNGDLFICIDADGLPTLWGVKPSYVFYKRPDGSIHYGKV